MIFIWISFALFYLYALLTKGVSTSLWLGLLFLWVLLATHYYRSHRKWKELDKQRREEREQRVMIGKFLDPKKGDDETLD